MPVYTISVYSENDFQELIEVFESNIPQYFALEEKAEFITYLNQEIEEYFVVRTNGRIIGAGGINYDSDHITARLSWDFMDGREQHKGAGTTLTQYRIKRLKQQDHIQKLIVRTSQFADTFYQKQGFQEIKQIPDYWAPGFDLVYMEYSDFKKIT